MKINNSTPEQDSIITLLNLQSNAGQKNPPSDDIFINSLVNDYLDGIVTSFKKAGVAQPINKLSAISDKISPEDTQLLLDIAAKY